MNFRSLIRPVIQEMPPRYVQRKGGGIRLDANESPYNLSDGLKEGLLRELAKAELNRYPDPEARALRDLLAARHEVHPEQILVANGSDDLIQVLMLLFWAPGAKMMLPVPTFGMYGTIGRIAGYDIAEVHLDYLFDLPEEDMVALARREGVKLILLSSPNNPTGNRFSEERIVRLVEESDAMVVLDESYAPFCGQNFIKRLRRYENLAVVRSLSPYGFAGIRVGMLFGAKDLVFEASKVRLPYSLDTLSQVTARFLLEHDGETNALVERVVAGRKWLLEKMSEIRGVTAYPSDSNMILFKVAGSGESVYRKLADHGVHISNLSKPGRLYNCLRVSVGNEEENGRFIEALAQSMI